MIHRNVFHNDALLPIEKVRLSPGQAGLICGWGIFTTLRISRGEAFAYERHWRRLEKDAGITRLPMPYSAARVRVHLHEVIRANKVTEGCARIYLVYNTVGFWQSDEKFPQADLIIYTAGLPEHREVVRLALRQHGRHAASPMSGVKSISWLNKGRKGFHAPSKFRMPGRRNARHPHGNSAGGRSFRRRTVSSPRRPQFRRRSFYLVDKPQSH